MIIEIKTKEINIEDAKAGGYVLAYDKDKKKKCYREITETHSPTVKEKDQIAIKLEDGSIIYTSVWHPTLIKMEDGTLDYVRADEMVIGNQMVSIDNELKDVIDIWSPEGVDENFADLTVAEHHNYFTTSNDGTKYVIHNTLGYHTYLQENGIPFEGLQAQFETRKIFSQIKIESERASMALAKEYGEPLWCVGTGFRNTHLRAVAPTISNSKLAGNVSAGIEPWAANVFTDQSAKGTFIRKNTTLTKYLKQMKKDTSEVWNKILEDKGSVQGLDFLDRWGFHNGELIKKKDFDGFEDEFVAFKDVFKTFKEINQLDLVRQAGVRQQYIDQGVSLNLAFPTEAPPKFINQVHMEAWELGVKTLYYMRSESVLRGDIAASATDPACSGCDG